MKAVAERMWTVLWNRYKGEHSKVLTEQEIQSKLYGFRARATGFQPAAARAHEGRVAQPVLTSTTTNTFASTTAQVHAHASQKQDILRLLHIEERALQLKSWWDGWTHRAGEWYHERLELSVSEWQEGLKRLAWWRFAVGVGIVFLLIIVFNVWSRREEGALPTDFVAEPAALQAAETPLSPVASVTPSAVQQAVVERTIPQAIETSQPITDTALPPAPAERAAAGRAYAIQVCIYETVQDTEALRARLRAAGLDAFFDTFETSRGRKLFRVFVGHFASYQAARKQLAQLQASGTLNDFPDSFIRTL